MSYIWSHTVSIFLTWARSKAPVQCSAVLASINSSYEQRLLWNRQRLNVSNVRGLTGARARLKWAPVACDGGVRGPAVLALLQSTAETSKHYGGIVSV
jgi:hypothetical protein